MVCFINTFKSNDVIALYQMCLKAEDCHVPNAIGASGYCTTTFTTGIYRFFAPDLTLWLIYASRQHLPKITQEFIAFVIENLNFYLNQQN